MACGRETANLWWWVRRRPREFLFGKKYGNVYVKPAVFRIVRSPYFLHDSFGQYFYRLIGCRLRGHRNVHNISDPGEPKKLYCFNCERYL